MNLSFIQEIDIFCLFNKIPLYSYPSIYCITSKEKASGAEVEYVILYSHSQKCDPTHRKSCRTQSFVSKKHSVYFSEHLFCSIRQLTCLYHVQRIISTLYTICTVSEPPLWCPRYHFSRVARYIRILLLALYNV